MILSIILMILIYTFFMDTFGQRLKELRIESGLTQKQLADKIENSQSAIFYWEKDKQEPSLSAILKLCLFFNVSADYLIGLEDETGSKKIYNFFNFKF